MSGSVDLARSAQAHARPGHGGKATSRRDGSTDAGLATRLLLRELLENTCSLRDAALDWSRIEGVHEMRVASRRLRSALRDFEPWLKRGRHRRASDAARKIADALGAVRDGDVAIAALDKLALKAPGDVLPGLGQFLASRRAQRESDRHALVQALSDEGIASLRNAFEAALEAPARTRWTRTPDLDHPRLAAAIRAAGSATIAARAEEMLDLGRRLYRPFAVRRTHRARIAAKRLRYAIELFARHRGARLDPFAVELAELQDSLGAVHDCDVWIEELTRELQAHAAARARDDPIAGDIPGMQRAQASTWLLGHFMRRRTRKYLEALGRWYDWEATRFFARMESAMRMRPPPRPAPGGDRQNARGVVR